MKDKLKEWAFEAGLIKTPSIAALGWITWSTAKGFLEAIVLVGTATIVCIHCANALIRQWCPVRRQKADDCRACRFYKSVFCSRCTEREK